MVVFGKFLVSMFNFWSCKPKDLFHGASWNDKEVKSRENNAPCRLGICFINVRNFLCKIVKMLMIDPKSPKIWCTIWKMFASLHRNDWEMEGKYLSGESWWFLKPQDEEFAMQKGQKASKKNIHLEAIHRLLPCLESCESSPVLFHLQQDFPAFFCAHRCSCCLYFSQAPSHCQCWWPVKHDKSRKICRERTPWGSRVHMY